MGQFLKHGYDEIMDLPPLTERPVLFSGREWLHILSQEYGEDLRGLSLAELERLPDTGWVQYEDDSMPSRWQSFRRRVPSRWLNGAAKVLHPSQPGFSFNHCPDFFDGKAYIASLIEKFGEDLELLPPAEIGRLPKLEVPPGHWLYGPEDSYLRHRSPAKRTDLERRGYEFLHRPSIEFSEE